SEVTRIMYGERKLERIYLLMRDGTKMDGYKVDEDAEKVLIREKEDSPREISISKKNIKQMSQTEIIPLNPSINARIGIFYPLNSQGSKLKPAIGIYLGSGMNFQLIKDTRINFEAGFAKNKSEHSGLYMRFIPLTASMEKNINFGRLHLNPKFTLGGVILDYDDGETDPQREFAFLTGMGFSSAYEVIERSLFITCDIEYQLIFDKKGKLHCLLTTLGASYRF
ncbi:MAG TPA: hypothetical protein PLM72_08700, partial [Spirochaetota bacterium]|nr:hypothetical protein [Spirochaetota bacterium]